MLDSYQRFSKKIRVCAVLTLLCFLGNQTGWSSQGSPLLQIADPAYPETRHTRLAEKISLPEGLGSVEERHLPEMGKEADFPTVVQIQDAHSSYEAQKNIKAILAHLHRNYGFELVLAEGGAGPLHPEYLRHFNSPRLDAALARYLARKKEIGGVELYLLDAGSGKIRGHGLEDDELYWKNVLEYRKVLSQRAVSEKFFRKAKEFFDRTASWYFQPALRSFLKEWTLYQDSPEQMLLRFDVLSRTAFQETGVDLLDASNQLDWPSLVRFARVRKLEKEFNGDKIRKEKEKLIQWIEEKKLGSFYSAGIEGFLKNPEQAGDVATAKAPRRFFETFYEKAKPLGFRFRDYPALSGYFAAEVLKQEIQPVRLMEEFEELTEQILDRLARSPEEKSLVQWWKEFRLNEKLFFLELSRTGFEKLNSRRSDFRPSAWVERLADIGRAKAQSGGGSANKQGLAVAGFTGPESGLAATDQIFDEAIRFYEGALKRDLAMGRNLVKVMKNSGRGKAVIVTGGFHSRGILEEIKKDQMAYVQVSPRISRIEEENTYSGVMMATLKSPLYMAKITMPSNLPEKILGIKKIFAAAHQRKLLRGALDLSSRTAGRRKEIPVLRSEARSTIPLLQSKPPASDAKKIMEWSLGKFGKLSPDFLDYFEKKVQHVYFAKNLEHPVQVSRLNYGNEDEKITAMLDPALHGFIGTTAEENKTRNPALRMIMGLELTWWTSLLMSMEERKKEEPDEDSRNAAYQLIALWTREVDQQTWDELKNMARELDGQVKKPGFLKFIETLEVVSKRNENPVWIPEFLRNKLKTRKWPREALMDPEKFHELAGFQVMSLGRGKGELRKVLDFTGHTDFIYSAVFSPDGTKVLTASKDGTLRTWSAATGREINQFAVVPNVRNTAVFSPDGNQILHTGVGKHPQIVDALSSAVLQEIKGHSGLVNRAFYSPDGKKIMTVGRDDGRGIIWDAATGNRLAILIDGNQNVSGQNILNGVFSKDGTRVLTVMGDKTVWLLDVSTGNKQREFKGHSENINTVVFSPDEKQILTAGKDQTARLWDVAQGREIAVFKTGASWVMDAVFSRDGKQVVMGDNNGNVQIWDIESHKEIQRVKAHNFSVFSLAVSGDGREILTAGADHIASLWELGPALDSDSGAGPVARSEARVSPAFDLLGADKNAPSESEILVQAKPALGERLTQAESFLEVFSPALFQVYREQVKAKYFARRMPSPAGLMKFGDPEKLAFVAHFDYAEPRPGVRETDQDYLLFLHLLGAVVRLDAARGQVPDLADADAQLAGLIVQASAYKALPEEDRSGIKEAAVFYDHIWKEARLTPFIDFFESLSSDVAGQNSQKKFAQFLKKKGYFNEAWDFEKAITIARPFLRQEFKVTTLSLKSHALGPFQLNPRSLEESVKYWQALDGIELPGKEKRRLHTFWDTQVNAVAVEIRNKKGEKSGLDRVRIFYDKSGIVKRVSAELWDDSKKNWVRSLYPFSLAEYQSGDFGASGDAPLLDAGLVFTPGALPKIVLIARDKTVFESLKKYNHGVPGTGNKNFQIEISPFSQVLGHYAVDKPFFNIQVLPEKFRLAFLQSIQENKPGRTEYLYKTLQGLAGDSLLPWIREIFGPEIRFDDPVEKEGLSALKPGDAVLVVSDDVPHKLEAANVIEKISRPGKIQEEMGFDEEMIFFQDGRSYSPEEILIFRVDKQAYLPEPPAQIAEARDLVEIFDGLGPPAWQEFPHARYSKGKFYEWGKSWWWPWNSYRAEILYDHPAKQWSFRVEKIGKKEPVLYFKIEKEAYWSWILFVHEASKIQRHEAVRMKTPPVLDFHHNENEFRFILNSKAYRSLNPKTLAYLNRTAYGGVKLRFLPPSFDQKDLRSESRAETSPKMTEEQIRTHPAYQEVINYYEAQQQVFDAIVRGDDARYQASLQEMEARARDALEKAGASETLLAIVRDLRENNVLKHKHAQIIEESEIFTVNTGEFRDWEEKIVQNDTRPFLEALGYPQSLRDDLERQIRLITYPASLRRLMPASIVDFSYDVRRLQELFGQLVAFKSARGMLRIAPVLSEDLAILVRPAPDVLDFKATYFHEIIHYLAMRNFLPFDFGNEIITQSISAAVYLEKEEWQNFMDLLAMADEETRELHEFFKNTGEMDALKGYRLMRPEEMEALATKKLSEVSIDFEKMPAPARKDMAERFSGIYLAGYAYGTRKKIPETRLIRFVVDYGKRYLPRVRNAEYTRKLTARDVDFINEIMPTLKAAARVTLHRVDDRLDFRPRSLRDLNSLDRTRWFYEEKDRAMHYIPWDIIEYGAEASIGLTLQEVFRANHTEEGLIEEAYDQVPFRLLYGVAETARVVGQGLAENPGRIKDIDTFYRKKLRIFDPQMEKERMAEKPLFVQYIEALFYTLAMTKKIERPAKDPRVTHPEVRAAIEKTFPILLSMLGEKGTVFYEAIRDKVWPEAAKLLEKDKEKKIRDELENEMLNKMIEDGEFEVSTEPGPPDNGEGKPGAPKPGEKIRISISGGSGGKAKPLDLSEKARQKLEEAIRKKQNEMSGEEQKALEQKAGEALEKEIKENAGQMADITSDSATQPASKPGQKGTPSKGLAGKPGVSVTPSEDLKKELEELQKLAGQMKQQAAELEEQAQAAGESAGQVDKAAKKIDREGVAGQPAGENLEKGIQKLIEEIKSLRAKSREFQDKAEEMREQADWGETSSPVDSGNRIHELEDSAREISETAAEADKAGQEAGQAGKELTERLEEKEAKLEPVKGRAQMIQKKMKEIQEKLGELLKKTEKARIEASEIQEEAKGKPLPEVSKRTEVKDSSGAGDPGFHVLEGKEKPDSSSYPRKKTSVGAPGKKEPKHHYDPRVDEALKKHLAEETRTAESRHTDEDQNRAILEYTGLVDWQRVAMDQIRALSEANEVTLRENILNALEDNVPGARQRHQHSGRLDSRSLAAVETGSQNIFTRKREPGEKKLRLSLLMDVSGSMYRDSNNFDFGRNAVSEAELKAKNRINNAVKTAILYMYAFRDQEEVELEIGIFASAQKIILPFGTPITDAVIFDVVYNILHHRLGDNNSDLAGLELMVKSLENRALKEGLAPAIMTIIADGGINYSDKEGIQKILEESRGIVFLPVGIGPDSNDVRNAYAPYGKVIADLDQLSREAGGWIQEQSMRLLAEEPEGRSEVRVVVPSAGSAIKSETEHFKVVREGKDEYLMLKDAAADPDFKIKINGTGIHIPDVEILETRTNVENLLEIIKSVTDQYLHRRPTYLIGEAGTGKNTLLYYAGKLLKQNVRFMATHEDMTADDLVERRGVNEKEKGKTDWIPSPIVEAMKHGDWVILDEVGKLDSKVRAALNHIVQSRRVRLHDGTLIEAKQGFAVIETNNLQPGSNDEKVYEIKKDSAEILDRRGAIYIDYLPPDEEIQYLGWELMKARHYTDPKQIQAEEMAWIAQIVKLAGGLRELYKGVDPKTGKTIGRGKLVARPLSTRALVKMIKQVARFPQERKRVWSLIQKYYAYQWGRKDQVANVEQKIQNEFGVDKYQYKLTPQDQKGPQYGVNKEGRRVLKFMGIEIPLGKSAPLKMEDVPLDMQVVWTDANLHLLHEILMDMVLQNSILMIGDAGTGKDTIAEYISYLIHGPVAETYNVTFETSYEDLIAYLGIGEGERVGKDGSLMLAGNGETGLVPAYVVRGMRGGYPNILSEINKAKPAALASLNNPLQFRWIDLANGFRQEAEDGWIIIGTMNLDKSGEKMYLGNYRLSGEFMDRFSVYGMKRLNLQQETDMLVKFNEYLMRVSPSFKLLKRDFIEALVRYEAALVDQYEKKKLSRPVSMRGIKQMIVRLSRYPGDRKKILKLAGQFFIFHDPVHQKIVMEEAEKAKLNQFKGIIDVVISTGDPSIDASLNALRNSKKSSDILVSLVNLERTLTGKGNIKKEILQSAFDAFRGFKAELPLDTPLLNKVWGHLDARLGNVPDLSALPGLKEELVLTGPLNLKEAPDWNIRVLGTTVRGMAYVADQKEALLALKIGSAVSSKTGPYLSSNNLVPDQILQALKEYAEEVLEYSATSILKTENFQERLEKVILMIRAFGGNNGRPRLQVIRVSNPGEIEANIGPGSFDIKLPGDAGVLKLLNFLRDQKILDESEKESIGKLWQVLSVPPAFDSGDPFLDEAIQSLMESWDDRNVVLQNLGALKKYIRTGKVKKETLVPIAAVSRWLSENDLFPAEVRELFQKIVDQTPAKSEVRSPELKKIRGLFNETEDPARPVLFRKKISKLWLDKALTEKTYHVPFLMRVNNAYYLPLREPENMGYFVANLPGPVAIAEFDGKPVFLVSSSLEKIPEELSSGSYRMFLLQFLVAQAGALFVEDKKNFPRKSEDIRDFFMSRVVKREEQKEFLEAAKKIDPRLAKFLKDFKPVAKEEPFGESGKPQVPTPGLSSWEEILTLKGHRRPVLAAVFSPDEKRIISTGDSGEVIVHNISRGEIDARDITHKSSNYAIAFHPDGEQIVVGGDNKQASIFKPGRNGILLIGHTGFLKSVAFSSDGHQVLTASMDGTARIWDAKTGNELARGGDWGNPFLSAQWLPGEREILAVSRPGGSNEEMLVVWDRVENKALNKIIPGGSLSFSPLLSPDGKLVLTGTIAGKLVVWSVVNGEKVKILSEKTPAVDAAVFTLPNWVQTFDVEGVVREWFLGAGPEISEPIPGGPKNVRSAVFTKNGKKLLTTSYTDNDLHLWDIPRSEIRVVPESNLEMEIEVARELFFRILESGRLDTLSRAEQEKLLWRVMPEKAGPVIEIPEGFLTDQDKAVLSGLAKTNDRAFGVSITPAQTYEEGDLRAAQILLQNFPHKMQVVVVKSISAEVLEKLNRLSEEILQGRVMIVRENEKGYGATLEALFRGDRGAFRELSKFVSMANALAAKAGTGRHLKLPEIMQFTSAVLPAQDESRGFNFQSFLKAELLRQDSGSGRAISEMAYASAALSVITAGLGGLDSRYLDAELLSNLKDVQVVGPDRFRAVLAPQAGFLSAINHLRAAAQALASAA